MSFGASSVAATEALATAVQPLGTVSSRLNRPFRSGWSKQGNTLLASEGTSSV